MTVVLRRQDREYLGETEMKYYDEEERFRRKLVQDLKEQGKFFHEVVKTYKATNRDEQPNSTGFGK